MSQPIVTELDIEFLNKEKWPVIDGKAGLGVKKLSTWCQKLSDVVSSLLLRVIDLEKDKKELETRLQANARAPFFVDIA